MLSPERQSAAVDARAEVVEAVFVAALTYSAALEALWVAHGAPLLKCSATLEEDPTKQVLSRADYEALALPLVQDALAEARAWMARLGATLEADARGHTRMASAVATLQGSVLRAHAALGSCFRSAIDAYGRLLNSPPFAQFVLNR
jgi:hypothetical protein